MPLDCTPAITTDLEDEHEHDERAGLGQDHHDEALHDAYRHQHQPAATTLAV
jgi:hypothetical protein